MRLICPNCEAQYEVSDDAITPGGRDVQCSNCQTSWFQTEKQAEPAPATPQPKPVPEVEPEPVPEVEPDPVPEVEPEAPVEIPQPTTPELPPETPIEEPEASNLSLMEELIAETQTASAVKMPPAEQAEKAPSPPMAPKRKALDSAVTSILRQEAARTTANDAAAASAKAEPPAPAPAPPAPRPVAAPSATEPARTRPAAVAADETRKHVATMAAQQEQTSDEDAEAHLRTVPSMNEINATLRARAQANDATGLTEAEKAQAVERKGFRRGFFAVALILLALILPYVFAGQITQNMPQTTDYMASYVMMIDKLRLSLSELIAGFTAG